ncbi:uncharacterized protein LOC118738514 [Rhagoletis pomonella]|uniref:uncharacterized protein LOC118738514 n=1 Tax=Rhagoletis pomonella TaxID=28610 RepID=UPI001785736A|nr:uncharacterized protein LOC118738514 [Rhagoletis pomonella]
MKWRMVPLSFMVIALFYEKALISTGQNATNSNYVQYCNHTNRTSHMWGDVDPNVFYMCDEANNTTRKLQCPAGRGFFNGRGYYGCIPYDEWPACMDNGGSSSNRSELGNSTAQVCRDEDHLRQTWAAVDPNKFYICQQADAEPLLLTCEPGKGYVSARVGHSDTHIVGCAAWQQWRMYMQCEGFY